MLFIYICNITPGSSTGYKLATEMSGALCDSDKCLYYLHADPRQHYARHPYYIALVLK